MDVPTFLGEFPEFSNPVQYPVAQVQMYLNVATAMLRTDRWDPALINYGYGLVIAHHLAISSRDQATAAVGGTPGLFTGPTNAKAVDKVSVSYDNGLSALDGAGHWNITTYGIKFLQLARMMGAGGIQIGYPGDFVQSDSMVYQ